MLDVSVEPLPKQGCELAAQIAYLSGEVTSQWNPCRSRGASMFMVGMVHSLTWSQWNPCRSRGARRVVDKFLSWFWSLSGTPAEAGVRGSRGTNENRTNSVSVEPLPKQGCEWTTCFTMLRKPKSLSGTPAEAGVRGDFFINKKTWVDNVSVEPLPKQGCELTSVSIYFRKISSQWNPCRSRGASKIQRNIDKYNRVSVEPLPKQGCEVVSYDDLGDVGRVSVEPLPKQGCERSFAASFK